MKHPVNKYHRFLISDKKAKKRYYPHYGDIYEYYSWWIMREKSPEEIFLYNIKTRDNQSKRYRKCTTKYSTSWSDKKLKIKCLKEKKQINSLREYIVEKGLPKRFIR